MGALLAKLGLVGGKKCDNGTEEVHDDEMTESQFQQTYEQKLRSVVQKAYGQSSTVGHGNDAVVIWAALKSVKQYLDGEADWSTVTKEVFPLHDKAYDCEEDGTLMFIREETARELSTLLKIMPPPIIDLEGPNTYYVLSTNNQPSHFEMHLYKQPGDQYKRYWLPMSMTLAEAIHSATSTYPVRIFEYHNDNNVPLEQTVFDWCLSDKGEGLKYWDN